ncbi:MAG TPA: hypothetical protein ENO29_06780 [Candidatus Aminicenantes bacterium]|nr:MAG: hypothetical protein C0168_08855 [Candidatus Aminicenantes bacterium]HEK86043.1 hypothetical protein [Candidatus Aminicenantes bacterium]
MGKGFRGKEFREMIRVIYSVNLKRLILFFAVIVLIGGLAQAQAKKYLVAVPEANLHLEPDEKSPVVISVPAGEVLAQASAVRFRHDWIFVYYISSEKGKTLAGYVQEQMLRKLFPEVNSIMISSGEQEEKPPELNLEEKYEPPIYWGMNQQKIQEIEGRPLAQDRSGETEVYQYRRQIMNKQCLIEYIFWRNELVSARFHLLDNYTDNNYYIADYLKIKNYLANRFGQPINDRVLWLDTTYQNKNQYWGKALGSGQLEFHSSWVVGDTEVALLLTGYNNHVAFTAECIGTKYKSFFSN